MTNLTKAGSGWYRVEINDGAQEQGYAVTVIREVPRPAVFFGPAPCLSTSEKCQAKETPERLNRSATAGRGGMESGSGRQST